ncbi:hypothetical protein CY35_18G058600 [Sphagnum magellanicum]|nr:hypothetical protein CY35_18G058600 [Sphagnum magellanicum]KAH9533553.1 hypothetical protein CY35_18G058600 [Sphagnum magellanicum]
MAATSEWQRRLGELIPNAEKRGELTAILLNMRHENVLPIFGDNDDAVLASLQQIHREATVSRIESVISTLQSLAQSLASCFSGVRTPEPTRLLLLPPPAVAEPREHVAEPREYFAEPREHVRTWKEWFSQLYGYMRRAVERFCQAALWAFDAVRSAVRSFMELLSTFFQQLQRTTESVFSYLQPLLATLERIVTAILAIQTAYNIHAHHH